VHPTMLVQAALPPEVGQLRGVPTQVSGFHLQPTTAHSVEVECKLQATAVPVQLPPAVPPLDPPLVVTPVPLVPPVPEGMFEPPLPPALAVACPAVPPDADGTVVPTVPPSAPASTAGVAHMQAAYTPAEVQVCAPCWPVGHAHSTLAPETHLAASLPVPQAPRNVTERNECTIQDLLHMGSIVSPSAPSGNSGDHRSVPNVSDNADCLNQHTRWPATAERLAVQRRGRRRRLPAATVCSTASSWPRGYRLRFSISPLVEWLVTVDRPPKHRHG